MTEDEMVGWHHRLDSHEFEQAPGVDDGQGSLGCCSPWGHKESDMAEQLDWTEYTLEHILSIYMTPIPLPSFLYPKALKKKKELTKSYAAKRKVIRVLK